MTEQEAIEVLEIQAIDLTGLISGMRKENPLVDVVQQRLSAIDLAQRALKERMKRAEKILTNADRIRAMSEKELAEMLKDYKDCGKNCIMSNEKHCFQICETALTLLKWLQQPAEEK